MHNSTYIDAMGIMMTTSHVCGGHMCAVEDQ